jgi:sterol desaturase/sphingolipid hydroxylase (fatty acid hydroxylase superfamily)
MVLPLSGLLVALTICFIIEVLVPLERVRWKSRLNGSLFSVILAVASVIAAFYLARLWRSLGILPLLPPIEQWAGWAAVPLTLIALDFLKYWEHRFEHRFMWAVHKVHHAPTDLHAANAYGHPLQAIPMFLFLSVPLSLLNFWAISTPIAAGLIFSFLAAFIHSPVDFHFGPLRNLLVDNRFHRIHHSIEPRHFDRNFGIAMTVWDRLFGTAHFPRQGEWPSVGVAGLSPPATVADFLAMPFKPSGTAGESHASPHRISSEPGSEYRRTTE